MITINNIIRLGRDGNGVRRGRKLWFGTALSGD